MVDWVFPPRLAYCVELGFLTLNARLLCARKQWRYLVGSIALSVHNQNADQLTIAVKETAALVTRQSIGRISDKASRKCLALDHHDDTSGANA